MHSGSFHRNKSQIVKKIYMSVKKKYFYKVAYLYKNDSLQQIYRCTKLINHSSSGILLDKK